MVVFFSPPLIDGNNRTRKHRLDLIDRRAIVNKVVIAAVAGRRLCMACQIVSFPERGSETRSDWIFASAACFYTQYTEYGQGGKLSRSMVVSM